MKPKYRLASAVAVAGVLAVTATALASTPTTAQVKTRRTSSLGTILVDGSRGKTLYMFGKDKGGKSSCYGACAANWPPDLTTKKPTASLGAKAALLGTTKRTDGKLQVTYNHHPLYWFKYDTRAGQTRGENVNAFGARWYAVSAKGTKVMPPSANNGGVYGGGGPTGPTGSGGYGGGGGYPPMP